MDCYKILGLENGASREQIETAYAQLRSVYKENMFLEGEEGNSAARKLTELDQAYSDIINELTRSEANTNFGSDLGDIDNLIRAGEYDRAQNLLDNTTDRTAEWHYLQSIIYYKRNWFLESKKQLQLAIEADPTVEKYRVSLTRLENVMASPNERDNRQQSETINPEGRTGDCAGGCGDCCLGLCIADCCCQSLSCCG